MLHKQFSTENILWFSLNFNNVFKFDNPSMKVRANTDESKNVQKFINTCQL